MRVMCIKSGKWMSKLGKICQDSNPQYGDICTVKFEKTILGLHVYWLEGYDAFYNANKFIPLSDKDETEILAERQSQFQFHHN